MKTPKIKYTFEILKDAVCESFSFTEVLQKLNSNCNGSSYLYVKRKIECLGIDTSHFIRYVPTIPKTKTRKAISEILVHDETKRARTETRQLKRAMLESSIEYICEVCKCPPIHNNIELVLQIDHIDGNFRNNTLENLRFICPNCHTQTSNYGNKSVKNQKYNKKEEICPDAIMEAINTQRINTYKELAATLKVGVKKITKLCKLYNISIYDKLDKQYIIDVVNGSSSVQEALKVLGISRWKYEKYKKEYSIIIKKPRTWITNGVEDRFVPKNSPIPEGFRNGKANNKPPRKKSYKDKIK